MWCVLELYVFVKITGGCTERVILKNLGGEAVTESLSKFDCDQAQCYWDHDREKILGVIEAGFDDLVPFNKIIKSLLSGEQRVTKSKKSKSSKSASSRDVVVVVP